MIKVQSMRNTDSDLNTYKVLLFSDTKDEVESTPLEDIMGLPENANIEFGSIIYTANLDVALMASDGNWVWN